MLNEQELLKQTADIVAAHLSNNPVPQAQLADLIREVYETLNNLQTGSKPEPAEASPLAPAVPIEASVFPDYIICLEDGMRLKMLKRHLHASYNMSPEEYRARWNLPETYPMVAPNYAKTRSHLAKQIGLGRLPKASPDYEAAIRRVPEGASSYRRGRSRPAA